MNADGLALEVAAIPLALSSPRGNRPGVRRAPRHAFATFIARDGGVVGRRRQSWHLP